MSSSAFRSGKGTELGPEVDAGDSVDTAGELFSELRSELEPEVDDAAWGGSADTGGELFVGRVPCGKN